MKPLRIVWQRLVTAEGETCDRCRGTERELQHAFTKLHAFLRPVGIEPVLETRTLDHATFGADPAASNRIWIDDAPLEHWLGAAVGTSRCCAKCDEAPCRTLAVDGEVYETIPESLILKAAVIAAASLLKPERKEPQPQEPATEQACCVPLG